MILERKLLRRSILAVVVVVACGFFVQSIQASNITGFVFDKQRNRLPDVDLELLNETYSLVGRTKTDSSGRYQFGGLGDGHYLIKAMPFRYDLEDQEWSVEIISFGVKGSGQGNTTEFRDFYLTPRKGGFAEAEASVIFVQDIPDAAESLYKRALKDFAEKREQEGVTALFDAIQIFPDYFDARYRMGKQLVIAGKYGQAWPYLLKATEINPKHGPSFYYMGICFHKLGPDYQKAAITSLKQASILFPGSMKVFYSLGSVERAAGKFEDAETHLLKAKKLADKPIPEIQKELAQLYGNDLKKFKEAADELEIYLKAGKGKMSVEDQKSTRATIESLREKAGSSVSTNES